MDLYIEVKTDENDDSKYVCNVWDAETSEKIHSTQTHTNVDKAIFEANIFIDSRTMQQIEDEMKSFRDFCNSCKLASPLPTEPSRDYCSG
jgi:hypothetical protein